MSYNNEYEEIWSFSTARFRIVGEAAPEYEPYDGDDEDGEIQRKIDDGTYAWFQARVRVLGEDDEELGASYLGMCCYEQPSDLFRDHIKGGGYCPSLVSEAIVEARETMKRRAASYLAA